MGCFAIWFRIGVITVERDHIEHNVHYFNINMLINIFYTLIG